MYCFADEYECRQFALPCWSGVGWMWADPDSVPRQLYEYAKQVTRRVLQKTDAPAIYAAIDFGYGTAPGEQDPHWMIIESNMQFPGVRNSGEHPEIGRKINNMFVQQIARLAGA